MREILFRGKRIDNGEWVEGYYAKAKDIISEKTLHVIFDLDLELFPRNEFSAFQKVDPATIGQYTGRMDRNGRRIFEGDVVRTRFGRLCVVEWFASTCHNGWDLNPIRTRDNLKRDAPTHCDVYDKVNLEVIGNIHDNPELLEEE